MPITRLTRARATLPAGYQFGDAGPRAHLHVFNAVSGYCACGLQYLPHLRPSFAHGGRVGRAPAPWMDDTRPRFVTVLPPGAAIETATLSQRFDVCFPSWRPRHLNAAEQLARRGWNVIEGDHQPFEPMTDAQKLAHCEQEYIRPLSGVYSGQGDEA